MNSKTKEYIRFKQEVLFPRWWTELGGATSGDVMIKCHVPGCKAVGFLQRVKDKFKLIGLDVGHEKRRGSHPELLCEYTNCHPECRYHNSLYAGVPMWSRKR